MNMNNLKTISLSELVPNDVVKNTIKENEFSLIHVKEGDVYTLIQKDRCIYGCVKTSILDDSHIKVFGETVIVESPPVKYDGVTFFMVSLSTSVQYYNGEIKKLDLKTTWLYEIKKPKTKKVVFDVPKIYGLLSKHNNIQYHFNMEGGLSQNYTDIILKFGNPYAKYFNEEGDIVELRFMLKIEYSDFIVVIKEVNTEELRNVYRLAKRCNSLDTMYRRFRHKIKEIIS